MLETVFGEATAYALLTKPSTRTSCASHFCGICRQDREPTSGLEPLTCSLRVNCSYWTILCFTLLNNRRYQRERRSVRRCNGRLAVGVLYLERLREGASDVVAADLTPPAQGLGRFDPACPLIVGEAGGSDDGVVEPALLQPLIGTRL